MSDPTPKLFYRILLNGAGWYWEIVDSENEVVERGRGGIRARSAAFEAAFKLLEAIPEPYPEGSKKCPDTFSI